MTDPQSQQLEELLERCILAHEQDDHDAIERVFAEHPDRADELRRRLDRLEQLGVLSVPSTPSVPESLGEFRLLHEIGRGGMGVVYLASQESLERRVALKLVHPEMLLFGNARARFRREVLVIARLQHPGIVPILTCGEVEGVPYYAMEFVPGASLAEVLGELVGTSPAALDGAALHRAFSRCGERKHDLLPPPDVAVFRGAWVPLCCRIVHEAAVALQYAHEQGVLHRDVKPSNLLLTAEGRVCVIDFGLASASGGDARLTRSGAALGSLPYMAPEQVRGEVSAGDARTDVYQLGATLYELLTTRPPFGDGTRDTRERILRGLPAPPSRDNPNVHPDVDGICLKALDVDPQRRYPSVQAFADDLLAFVEQRNVAARRAPLPVRVGRWVRARPVPAVLAFAAFVLLVVLPTGYAVQQSLANRRIRSAYDVAEDRRLLAERNFEEALRAVDLMLVRTAAARLADVPRTVGLRRQLVQDAIAVHRRLLSTTEDGNERLAGARARSQLRLGALHLELGEYADAERALLAARATLDGLLASAADDDDVALRADLMRCELELGRVLGRTGRIEAMVAAYERMDGHAARLADGPAAGEHRAERLEARLTFARGLAQVGRVDEARQVWDALDAALADPAATGVSPPERQLLRSRVASSRGTLAALSGDPTAAAAHFEAALRRADDGRDGEGTAAQQRALAERVADAAERLGTILLQRRDWDAAAPWLSRCCAEYEALVAADPEIPDWRVALARALGARAWNDTQRGAPADALASHERAIVLLEEVVAAAPDDVPSRRALAQAHADRASTCHVTGAVDEARRSLDAAAAQFEQLLERAPDDDFVRGNYAALLANRALATAAGGDPGRARELLERALELQRRIVGFEPRRQEVEMALRASEFAFAAGAREAGVAHMERAREAAAAMSAARPDDALALDTGCSTALEYGVMLQAEGRAADAVAAWRAALPTARRAAEASPFGRKLLAQLQLRLATAGLRADDVATAREWFRAAVADGATREIAGPSEELRALFDRADLR